MMMMMVERMRWLRYVPSPPPPPSGGFSAWFFLFFLWGKEERLWADFLGCMV